MKQPLATTGPAALEFGRMLGRREAFALVAGRCSAADVECLRRIRDEKLYRGLARNWDVFCTAHLGTSRRNIERSIGYLEEFGPQYFTVAQMTHIGAGEYRAIAAHVTEEGVRLDGDVIALLPENSDRVAAAVGELRRRGGKPPATPEAPSFGAVMKSCESAACKLEDYSGDLSHDDQLDLASVLVRLRLLASRRGVLFTGW